MSGGNSALVGVISGAAMVGAFGGMVSQKLVAVDKSALSCVLGGVFMAILLYVSGKFKISWLKEWNLTIAILVANSARSGQRPWPKPRTRAGRKEAKTPRMPVIFPIRCIFGK